MAWLLKYQLDEAASGTSPATLIDTGASNQDLTINYGTGGLVYTEDSSGRGLNIPLGTRNSLAGNANASATSEFISAMSGRTKLTIFLKVVSGFIGADSYTTIFETNSGGTPLFYVRAGGSGFRTVGLGGHEIVASGASLLAICIDTTQANQADRVRAYRSDTDTPATVTIASNTLALNDAIADLTGALVYFLNSPPAAGNRNPSGTTKFFGIWDDACTLEQVTSAFTELYTDDDSDPLPAPSFSIVSGPTVSNQTSSGFRVGITTSLDATVDILVAPDGTSQPTDLEFDAAVLGGNSTAYSVFNTDITGQTEDTTFTVWVRANDGVSSLYASVQATTLAVQNTIISINNGNPIVYGQTGISVLWDGGATGTTETTINGVTQANHTVVSDTETTFNLVWPNTMYGQTKTLSIGSTSSSTPIFIPATGYDYVTLTNYNSSSTGVITTTPPAVNNDQFVWSTESNTIAVASNGVPTFTSTFDGTMSVAVVDSSDGSHSAFEIIYYEAPADIIPDQFDLGTDATDQEPNSYIVRSFTVLGVDSGIDVTFTATGAAQVSADNSVWGSSAIQQLNGTIYVRIQTPALNQPSATGGVSSSGVSDSFTVSVRPATNPTITSQPTNQSVTSGSTATFVVGATNASAFQWYRSPSTILPGQTSGSLSVVTVIEDNGNQYFCRVFSSEGGYVDTNTVTLTVSPANVSIVSAEVRDLRTGVLITNTVLPIRVRRADGSVALTANVTTNGSGIFTVTNNTMGVVGDVVGVEFLDNSFGTYNGFEYTLISGV